MAFYDALTGLPNRRFLMEKLQQATAASRRYLHQNALLFIDLDNFKLINDSLGHAQGDILLQQVGNRIATCMRESDVLARLGGDEFVVLLEHLDTDMTLAAVHAEMVGEKIRAILNQNFRLNSYDYQVTASIGISLLNAEMQTDTEELLQQADTAMFQAKAGGRNTIRFFDPEMSQTVQARARLETEFRAAIAHAQFILYYQPQVDRHGQLVGAEALVRWLHPVRGMVSPAEFIPLAEETGLILPLGTWVLEDACKRLALWASMPKMCDLTIAVNVSARQFRQKSFVDDVLAVLARTGARPSHLKLELTEGLLLENIEETIEKMTLLQLSGVAFSLDDFGTGYSSLSYLKRLPLNQLKIDQSFVRDILIDPNDAAIAKMVITLASTLGLQVIAEGVETREQRDFLATQGCNHYQGYFFGRPVPAEEFAGLTFETT
jgi:diguanylate cyclase (GGDEF)-like protein